MAETVIRLVKAGTIAFWLMGDVLVIYPSDAQTYSPMKTVGSMAENLELFKDRRSSKKIRISLATVFL